MQPNRRAVYLGSSDGTEFLLERRTTFLLACLSGLLAVAGVAQSWRPDSTTIKRLNWGTVDVLVQADSVNGLLVWAETSPLAFHGQRQSFSASFSPESLDSWVERAGLIISTTAPPQNSTTDLASPPLIARDGSRLYVFRRQKKGRWESRIGILLSAGAGHNPWHIDTDRADAVALVQALWVQGGRSRQQPDLKVVHDANPLNPRSCPTVVPGTLVLRYPDLLAHRGEMGQVWMSYVVQQDGRVDTTSVRVLLSDEPQFALAAIQALHRARFEPAKVGGVPVAAWVHQQFYFRIH